MSARGVEYGILGPLTVSRDGRELQLGGARQRSVLAVLLLRANELVPTARIVDELWGERLPATAVKAVQVQVSQLRKLLDELTRSRRVPRPRAPVARHCAPVSGGSSGVRR